MSDRWIFVTAFLIVVFMGGGAFAIPEYFVFELLKSLIYVAIAVMVFFGEDRYSYMLGIVAPPLWFILNILLGGFLHEFRVLWYSVTFKPLPGVDTPLHGLALILEVILVILSVRAWRKQVPEALLGKTFGICLMISLVYVGALAGWYFRAIPTGAGIP